MAEPASAARRPFANALMLLAVLTLVAACANTKELDVTKAKLEGRPIVALQDTPKPMEVGIDLSDPSMDNQAVGLQFAVLLINASTVAASGLEEKAKSVAMPSFDPAKLVEDQVLADIATRYHAVPAEGFAVALKSTAYAKSWPDSNRVAGITASAKTRGFDGLVVDFAPLAFGGLTRGNSLWVGGPKVRFNYDGRFALIDTAKGEVLAAYECRIYPKDGGRKIDEVLAAGQPLVDAEVRDMANRCVEQITAYALKHP